MKKKLLAIVLATIWISISEFIRNEYLVKSNWENHYKSLGLIFPNSPLNGAIWGLWSLCFAVSIYIISTRFNFKETTFISWFMTFVFMWLVIGNLGVLPFSILTFAIPLSLLETIIASWIIFKFKEN